MITIPENILDRILNPPKPECKRCGNSGYVLKRILKNGQWIDPFKSGITTLFDNDKFLSIVCNH